MRWFWRYLAGNSYWQREDMSVMATHYVYCGAFNPLHTNKEFFGGAEGFTFISNAEPEPHHLFRAGSVTGCGSGSDNGINHG
jgi:hypothetical protein